MQSLRIWLCVCLKLHWFAFHILFGIILLYFKFYYVQLCVGRLPSVLDSVGWATIQPL